MPDDVPIRPSVAPFPRRADAGETTEVKTTITETPPTALRQTSEPKPMPSHFPPGQDSADHPVDPRLVYGEYDADGVDLSLIRHLRRLSPVERIRRGDRARRDAQRLLAHGRRQRHQQS